MISRLKSQSFVLAESIEGINCTIGRSNLICFARVCGPHMSLRIPYDQSRIFLYSKIIHRSTRVYSFYIVRGIDGEDFLEFQLHEISQLIDGFNLSEA